MSSEIEFEQIVSNSASNADEYEPLGTLAGRGVNTNKKGGKVIIKINEPCYIMGIASITPRVDYGDGEDWDNYLETLDDLHKPQMDGIGFQDLLTREFDSSGYGVKNAVGTTCMDSIHNSCQQNLRRFRKRRRYVLYGIK